MGTVRDSRGNAVGETGCGYIGNNYGSCEGRVYSDGTITQYGQVVGRIDSDGSIYDPYTGRDTGYTYSD